MTNDVKVSIKVSDGGSTAALTKEGERLKNVLKEAADNASKIRTPSSVGSAQQGVANSNAAKAGYRQQSEDYGRVRGGVGTGAAGRDFAKQSQGLGGLVALYATFAANIFAVGAAYEALNKAAATERLSKATDLMSETVGMNLKKVSNSLVEASGHALSFAEAMQFTNIGTSAGLASKQIEGLTKIARGAASALGRDVGDSVRRIIQGTAKQEQEILDELGIFIKANQAYEKYAKTFNIKVEDLTGTQRTQAYANEVERLGQKWAEFKDIPDPFSKFAATGKNALNDLLQSVNTFITPVLKILSESENSIKAIIVLITGSLIRKGAPELGNILKNLFTIDKEKTIKDANDVRQRVLASIDDISQKLILVKKEQEALLKLPPVTRQSVAAKLGTENIAVRGGQQGISAERIATELLGKSKLKELDQYKELSDVQKAFTTGIHKQINASSDQIALMDVLVKKGILSKDSTVEKLVLDKKGVLITQELFKDISANVNKAQQELAIKAKSVALSKELSILEKEKLTYGEMAPLKGSKPVKATRGPASSEDLVPSTTAIVANNNAKLAAVEINTAKAASEQVANLATEKASLTNSIQALTLRTSLTATILLTAAQRELSLASLTAAGAMDRMKISIEKGFLATLAASIKATISFIVQATILPIRLIATALGFTSASTAAITFASVLNSAKVAVYGFGTALSAAFGPAMLVITGAMLLWDLFGDSFKKLFPTFYEARDALAKQNEALADTTKSAGFAAIAIGRLNIAQKEQNDLSDAQKADNYKILSNSLNEYINSTKSLIEKDDEATTKAAENAKKIKMLREEGAYSAEASYYKQLANNDSLTDSQKEQAKKQSTSFLDLAKLKENGYITEKTYNDQLILLKKQYLGLDLEINAALQSRQADFNKYTQLITSSSESLDKLFKQSKNLKDPTSGFNTAEAKQAFTDYSNVLSNTNLTVDGVNEKISKLTPIIQHAGKGAAEAAVMVTILNKALMLVSQSRGLLNMAQAVEVYANEAKTAMNSLIKSLDTPVKGKGIIEYTQKSKDGFKQIAREIDAAKVAQSLLDRETANISAINTRYSAIVGYIEEATNAEVEKASVIKNAADQQISQLQALETLRKVIDSKKAGPEAKDAAKDAYAVSVLASKETEKTANQTARITRENANTATGLAKIGKLRAQDSRELSLQDATRSAFLAKESALLNIIKESNNYSEKDIVNKETALEQQKLLSDLTAGTSAAKLEATRAEAELKLKLENVAPEQKAAAKDTGEAEINDILNTRTGILNTNYASSMSILKATSDQKSYIAGINDEMKTMETVTSSLALLFGELGTNIGGAASALLKMSTDDKAYLTDKLAIESKIADMYTSPADRKTAQTDLAVLEKKHAKDKLTNIANAAGATKKMFAEHTVAYKVLNAVEKVSHVMKMASMIKEQAMAAYTFIKDMFFTKTKTTTAIAGSAAEGGAELAKEAMTLPAKIAGAIASLFSSSGWLAFGLVGVMLALIGKGGGKSAPPAFSASSEQRQEVAGTGQTYDTAGNKIDTGGGVFGDSSAKSESITKSIELLASNSIEGLDYDDAMLKSFNKLSDALTKAAQAIYTIPGLRLGGTSFGDQPGSKTLSKGGLFGTGLLGGVFGGGTSATKSVTSAGIQLRGSLQDIIDDTTGSISAYKNVLTQFHEDGGWFGSDSDWSTNIRQFDEVGKEVREALSDVFLNAKDIMTDIGSKVGVGVNVINNAFASINFEGIEGDIDSMGLSGQAALDQLNAVVSAKLDETAKKLFISFDRYKKFGEGFLETTIRVVDGNVKLDQSLRSIGSSFNIVDKFHISEEMIKAAGGLQVFMEQASFFKDSFLSDAEKLAPVQKSVSAQLAKLHISTDISREDFKKLVLAQDLGTQGGQDLYQSLMKLAPGFDIVAKAAEATAALNVSLLTAQGKSYEVLQISRDKVIANMSKEDRLIQESINLTEDANKTTTIQNTLDSLSGNTAKVLVATRKTELLALSESDQLIQKRIYLLQDEVKKSTIQQSIYTALGDTESALAITRANELKAMEDILRPYQIYLYSLQDEATLKGKLTIAYNKESAAIKGTITSLTSSIKTLKDYRTTLTAGSASTLTPAEKYAQSRVALFQTAASAQATITDTSTAEQVAARDTAVGQLSSTSDTFLAASREMYASGAQYTTDFSSVLDILSTSTDNLVAQKTTAESQLEALDSSVTFLTAIASSTDTVASLLTQYYAQQGITAQAKTAIPGLASGGIGNGITMVGERGPEIVDFKNPGRVYSNRASNDLLNTKDLVAEIKALREEVSQLRADQKEQTGHLIATNYDANNKNANTVAVANETALRQQDWKTRSQVKVA
jgi:hypothetical protein